MRMGFAVFSGMCPDRSGAWMGPANLDTGQGRNALAVKAIADEHDLSLEVGEMILV